MNIVYLIKVNRSELPNKYIGSKANCDVKNGVIYDERGKPYVGSSTDKTYKSIVEFSSYTLQVLGSFGTYEEALNAEKITHIRLDVVASPEYFNKSIATISNYSNPAYATYRHISTGKVARLPRDHPDVINGFWCGVTKGVKFSEEEKQKRPKQFGDKNGFFGKTHKKETKDKIRNTKKDYYESEKGKAAARKHGEFVRSQMTGVPKTKEHREKIGRKGLIMIKNSETLECIRINKTDKSLYDSTIWMNPYTLKLKLEKQANENKSN